MMNHKSQQFGDLIQQMKGIAVAASKRAYAPYSGLHIGAAVMMSSGAVHHGCNIENASFSLCLCAERVAFASAVSQYGANAEIEACLVYTSGNTPLAPCGACRQFMSEFMATDATVLSVCDGESVLYWQIRDLLPEQFEFPSDHNGVVKSC